MRFLLLLLLPLNVLAWTDADEHRYQDLLVELRCLVCQNQSIADSAAPLAKDLRKQVRGMIEAGKSDAEIKHYMTERYGDFVLYNPPIKASTIALWLGPFLLLVLGGLLVWRQQRGPVAIDETEIDRKRLRSLLGDDQ